MLKFTEMPTGVRKVMQHPAYTDGFIARMFDTSIEDGPYVKDSREWHIWCRGWRAANRISERREADPDYRLGLEDGTRGSDHKNVSFSYTTGWTDGDYTRQLWRNFGGADI